MLEARSPDERRQARRKPEGAGRRMIEVALDTASDIAGVALTEEGALVAEVTWHTRQNHSRELLPTLDWLLSRQGLTKDDIAAVYVCLGPGSYAGLRVGVSTAKALAYALGVPIAGVGRLAAEAGGIATDGGPRVVAVHAAGRAELAWAAYGRKDGRLLELIPPRLGRQEALLKVLGPGDVVCGDLGPEILAALAARGVSQARPALARVLAVAAIGRNRLLAGDTDDPDSLVPLYLREPAIGPQPRRPELAEGLAEGPR